MQIKSILPYYGAKRNMAATIITELGPHRVYWELLCGSMAVLLAKPACVMETANDLHGDLHNLARVVQDEELAEQLCRRLQRTLTAEGVFREAVQRIKAGEVPAVPGWSRAADFMVASWLGMNGVTGLARNKFGFCVRYTSTGGNAATRWASVVDSIPAWHQRLRNVTILRRNAFELLPRIEDKAGTVIYADPPYIEKGDTYVHDFTPEQHDELAEHLRRFKHTRVVVSYYEHPRLAELYPGWTCRHCDVSKALAHSGRRGANDTRAPEVLLINGPSLAQAAAEPRLFN